MRNISETEYRKMCQNVENVRNDIVLGKQLKSLI